MMGAQLLDRYMNVSKLGHGGVGIVYRAHDHLQFETIAARAAVLELLAKREVQKKEINELLNLAEALQFTFDQGQTNR